MNNKRKQWGVRVIETTPSHTEPQNFTHQIGYWKVIYLPSTPKPTELYYTRQEAEAKAFACHQTNPWWNYAAQKYHTHEKK